GAERWRFPEPRRPPRRTYRPCSPRLPSGRRSVATLVLLAAAAVAQVVPADLASSHGGRLTSEALPRRVRLGHNGGHLGGIHGGHLPLLPRRSGAIRRRGRGGAGGGLLHRRYVEDGVDDVTLNAGQQALEGFVAFLLVH